MAECGGALPNAAGLCRMRREYCDKAGRVKESQHRVRPCEENKSYQEKKMLPSVKSDIASDLTHKRDRSKM